MSEVVGFEAFFKYFQTQSDQIVDFERKLTIENLFILKDEPVFVVLMDAAHRLNQKVKYFKLVLMNQSFKDLLGPVSNATTVGVDEVRCRHDIPEDFVEVHSPNGQTEENVDSQDSLHDKDVEVYQFARQNKDGHHGYVDENKETVQLDCNEDEDEVVDQHISYCQEECRDQQENFDDQSIPVDNIQDLQNVDGKQGNNAHEHGLKLKHRNNFQKQGFQPIFDEFDNVYEDPDTSTVDDNVEPPATPDFDQSETLFSAWANVLDDHNDKHKGRIVILKQGESVFLSMVGAEPFFSFPMNRNSNIVSHDGMLLTLEFSEGDDLFEQAVVEFANDQDLQSFTSCFENILISRSTSSWSDDIPNLVDEAPAGDELQFTCNVNVFRGPKAFYINDGQLTAEVSRNGGLVTVVDAYGTAIVDHALVAQNQNGIPYFCSIPMSVTFGATENGQSEVFTFQFENANVKERFIDFCDF